MDAFTLWVSMAAAALRAVSDFLDSCGPRRPWDGES